MAKRSRKLKIEYVKISKLKLWKDNPRRNDEAAEKLAELLGQYGFLVPVIATRDGTVRAGATRIKAARMDKMDEVPVIYVDFGSEEEAQLFSIAENRSHEWADWDEETLRGVVGNLVEARPDDAPQLSGFTPIEIEGLITTPAAPRSLADAIREFERETEEKKEAEEYWVWVMVPNKQVLTRLYQAFGFINSKDRSRRELDWKKVRKKLLPAARRRSAES